MRLSTLHEHDHKLKAALNRIYSGAGHQRGRLHKQHSAATPHHGSRNLGDGSANPTPLKPRHRRFFRMGNDGDSRAMAP